MTIGTFPLTRMRRNRNQLFCRDLVSETNLTTKNLILPVFVVEGQNKQEAIPSMPNVFRYSVDNLISIAELCVERRIPALALFPVVDPKSKSLDGAHAWDPNSLVPHTIKAIKDRCPNLGIIADIALDPFTTHGQDGIIDSIGNIINDVTNEALTKQALCYAAAGADIVAPSDMMDGRIGVIRRALEEASFTNTGILAYSAKYASNFYGPFRDAVGSKTALGKSSKSTYQMDQRNSKEALREIALDIQEGADIVMVKPGLPYLDIIKSATQTFHIPVFAYNVSGEYCMVKAAAEKGWLNERLVVLEILNSFRRAGASAILTYHALDAAKWLSEND